MAGNGPARDWVAIDFGTCYSSAALMLGGRPVVIKEPIEHRFSVPSSVLVTKQGEHAVGYAAERRKGSYPGRYAEQFKRDLGRPVQLQLGDEMVPPVALVADVLRFLRLEAEPLAGSLPEVVLTIPASYEQHRRGLMLDAADMAGFERITFLEEPVAAAMAREGDSRREELVLVYDLGGGTFDAALVEFSGAEPRVLGFDGLDDVGGANFDRAIERHLAAHAGPVLQDLPERLSSSDPAERVRAKGVELIARDFCRRVKHDLSRLEHVDDILALDGKEIEYELSRTELARLMSADLQRTVGCCEHLVERSGRGWGDVDAILLVGGTCRLPFVGRRLSDTFDRPLQYVHDPELAVSLGAARWLENGTPPRTGRPDAESAERRRAAAHARLGGLAEQKRQERDAARRQAADRRGLASSRREKLQASVDRMDVKQLTRDALVSALHDGEDWVCLYRCTPPGAWNNNGVIMVTNKRLVWVHEPWYAGPDVKAMWWSAVKGVRLVTQDVAAPQLLVTSVDGHALDFGFAGLPNHETAAKELIAHLNRVRADDTV